jgi:hypothetical protein
MSKCWVFQEQLDPAAETVVLCHHGVRSMNAAMVSYFYTMVIQRAQRRQASVVTQGRAGQQDKFGMLKRRSAAAAAAAAVADGCFVVRCCWSSVCSCANNVLLPLLLLLLLPVPGVTRLH